METLSSAAPEITTSEPVQLEVRNAAPEFDQRDVTQKLSIPALILVLLALFAVLIFEGRLRRLAHAAAVRRAGPYPGASGEAAGHPAGPGYPAGPGFPPGPGFPGGPGYPSAGYPAGPGYASVGYPAPPGYAPYAPIISFVPVHTPGGPVQYGAVYQDPAYVPEAQPEPVVLHPDEYTSEEESYRAPFEPLVPVEEPPADIPAGGAEPYDDSPERPLGAASAAETGDSEPWQQTVQEARPAEAGPGVSQPVADEVTAVQPLPQQEERGRGWWRRSK
ncbi:hypothetical protein GCM10012289_24820 [Nonomuraea cavernae]|uniref:Uncharacterized protein n=1 Tax=Nonomuraea cavernae TaxID=2045107 RepID=A0A917YVD8_9ACTN|nr:hypothetical protein GCM10012289_24820 [Nonomuraea cavernae]